MKRLAWLVLALCCTAFLRVQPVESAQSCACACCHCKVPGDCGMPCGRVPAPAPVMFAAAEQATAAQPARRLVVGSVRRDREKFYAPFVEAATSLVALNSTALLAPAVCVPFFKAHCSFLI
jgi:hypothetical protein